ncbi:inosine/xanthosine triphosphatase [Thermoproteota archaeon]
MLVILGSTNPVKVNATKQAFDTYFDDVEVKGIKIPSGIKPFPTSDEETFKGAVNRVNAASEMEQADYYVGLEGGLQNLKGFTIVKQIAVVKKGEQIYVGVSSGYTAPEPLIKQLDMTTDESRKILDKYFGKKEILSKEGIIGVLTDEVLNRTITSRDAVICALTGFINPQYYE